MGRGQTEAGSLEVAVRNVCLGDWNVKVHIFNCSVMRGEGLRVEITLVRIKSAHLVWILIGVCQIFLHSFIPVGPEWHWNEVERRMNNCWRLWNMPCLSMCIFFSWHDIGNNSNQFCVSYCDFVWLTNKENARKNELHRAKEFWKWPNSNPVVVRTDFWQFVIQKFHHFVSWWAIHSTRSTLDSL